MKIIHLPTATGNHGYSLACAERRAGHESHALVVGNNPLNMKADEVIKLPSNKLLSAIKKARLAWSIRNKYDVFHFNFGQSLINYHPKILRYLDLPLYKGAKFATFNGSDVRQNISRDHNPYSPFLEGSSTFQYMPDQEKRERIQLLFRHLDFAFAQNPDLLNFLPNDKAAFLPYIKESWFDGLGMIKKRVNKRFKIVHAPTNRSLKGTDYIVDAINLLKQSYAIDFVLVEGMSHEEAKRTYASADLMIDQVRLGWYGGVAVEAMRMGVPVAVYINPADLKFIPRNMRNDLNEAFLQINPFNIYEQIAGILDSEVKYQTLCESSIDFVNTYHDPDKVIHQVLSKYEEFL